MNDEKIIKGLKNRKRSSLEKAIEKYSAYVLSLIHIYKYIFVGIEPFFYNR